MRMENSTPLSEAQKVALDKLTASLGPEYVEFLVSQGLEVLTARVAGFLQYEASLLGQIQAQMASAMPTRYVSVPDEEARPRPLRLEVKTYSGKEGGNLILWIREIEMAMRSGLIKLDHQQVSLAISKLDGRASKSSPCDYIHGGSPYCHCQNRSLSGSPLCIRRGCENCS